jgi:hypothetical protein
LSEEEMNKIFKHKGMTSRIEKIIRSDVTTIWIEWNITLRDGGILWRNAGNKYGTRILVG